ncbi:anti-sigma factor family protein [Solidesulfovibrio alcoholivorans]|uniref:anti-sigma factor family protein n=1 Tax=Solidesulfovibrio alcoholivorans TaxID=81406 RepID=UPI0009FF5C3A|nr:zf-HC2 domain-containing protein [Solidesulfovibrio alcoholivorans]
MGNLQTSWSKVMRKHASTREGCALFRQKLAAFADGEMSADWREKIESHLATCPECRQALSELRSLSQTLEDPISVRTRPDFTQDVLRKVNSGACPHRHDWFHSWGKAFPAPAGIALAAMLGLALGGWLGHSLVGIDGHLLDGTLARTATQSATIEALDIFSPMPKGTLAHGYLTVAGEVAQ